MTTCSVLPASVAGADAAVQALLVVGLPKNPRACQCGDATGRNLKLARLSKRVSLQASMELASAFHVPSLAGVRKARARGRRWPGGTRRPAGRLRDSEAWLEMRLQPSGP